MSLQGERAGIAVGHYAGNILAQVPYKFYTIPTAYPNHALTSVQFDMEIQVAPLAAILDLNTDLLTNCLDGLSDDEARRCLAAGGNSVAFLAAHLTDSRHFLAGRLGAPLANPLAHYLVDVRSIEEIREWPSLNEIRSAWLGISTHLQRVLAGLTAAEVSRPDGNRFPLGDPTQLGMIAFLVQHDCYHLGQVAFLRRQLGKPAMSYARQTSAAPASSSG